jgi:hypothetical protein
VCTLLVYVDDATSRLMTLHFTATESTFSYYEATRAYLERHGKPVAFYSDRASVFHAAGRGVTQFGRAMSELNIDTFCANSSPANGIVERLHKTMLNEFCRITFRKKIYTTINELQTDLDAWLDDYNNQRERQGRWCYGKTPMRTFLDSLELAREKLIPH